MRNVLSTQLNSWRSILSVCWVGPLLFGLILAFLLNWYTTANSLSFSPGQVASMAGSLSGILAAVSALLIAVLMSVYVQGRRNRIEGFNGFLGAVSDYKALISEIYLIASKSPSANKDTLLEWASCAVQFTARMNKVTPAWRGYEYDRATQERMYEYDKFTEQKIDQLTEGLPPQILKINNDHDRYLRIMLMGLRAIDEGVVEQHLERRLFRIFLSIVALLVLCLAIGTIAGLEARGPAMIWEFGNPLIYVALPAVAVGNFLGLVWSIYRWQKDIQQRDDAWAWPRGRCKGLPEGSCSELAAYDDPRQPF